MHKYDRYHGRHDTYDRHALDRYATPSSRCVTCDAYPSHVRDDRYAEKKHSNMHKKKKKNFVIGDEAHTLHWELMKQAKLAKVERSEHKKRAKEMEKLLTC